MRLVRIGKKRSTVRAGARQVRPGAAELVSDQSNIPISITHTEIKTLSALSYEDALTDGFESVSSLRNALLSFYPNLSEASPVTIIFFEPL